MPAGGSGPDGRDGREGRNAPPVASSDRVAADPAATPGDDRDPPEEPRGRDLLQVEHALSLDPCRRWEQVPLSEPHLPVWVDRELPTHLDPSSWGAGFLRVEERELPPELYADLRECTPQAVLRDLHRVVKAFYVTPEEIEGTKLVSLWQDNLQEAREAREREPLPSIGPTTAAVREEQLRRRAFLAEEWKPLLADDAPRKDIKVWVMAEDLDE